MIISMNSNQIPIRTLEIQIIPTYTNRIPIRTYGVSICKYSVDHRVDQGWVMREHEKEEEEAVRRAADRQRVDGRRRTDSGQTAD